MVRVRLVGLASKANALFGQRCVQPARGNHVFSIIRRLQTGSNRYAASLSLDNTPFPDISLDDRRMQSYLEQLEKDYEEMRNAVQLASKALRTRTDFLRRVVAMRRNIDSVKRDLLALDEMERNDNGSSKSSTSSDLQQLVEQERADYGQRLSQLNEELYELLASAAGILNKTRTSSDGDGDIELDADEVSDVLVEVNSGVGGVESMLFARELVDMYSRYFAFKGWRAELTQYTVEERGGGGVREATFSVHGDRAFSTLMFEVGVHRVQRVPQTDSRSRLHTSTVSVAVLPNGGRQLDALVDELLANEKHLRMDTFSSSGPGGQHVNKTQSAVRITHLPTGVVVECQEERSQIRNRDIAMHKLRTKLYERVYEERTSRVRQQRRMQVGTRARSEKIRTYNFQQDRVTDHRLQITVHGLARYLQGDVLLDSVVDAARRAARNERLNAMIDDASVTQR